MDPKEFQKTGGTQMRTAREAGFSLVEMLVAVAMTVIVAGAIYGLLAGGQTGFRREPEKTARQQNIREAMDQIMRDIANAGSGLPPVAQVFTPGLYSCAACPDGGSPMGVQGHIADELEILTNDTNRENEEVCGYGHTSGTNNSNGNGPLYLLRTQGPNASTTYPVVLIFNENPPTWTPRYVTSWSRANPPTAIGTCTNAAQHVLLNFAGGDPSGFNTGNLVGNSGNGAVPGSNGGCGGVAAQTDSCTVDQIAFAELVRYRIRLEPGTGDPLLERIAPSNPANPNPYPENPQLVARGIEDLQVQYTQFNGTVSGSVLQANGTINGVGNGAPVVNTYQTLVTSVQVTLWARSTLPGQRLQGQTTDPNLVAALRGELIATAAPRSALLAVESQSSAAGTPAWQ